MKQKLSIGNPFQKRKEVYPTKRTMNLYFRVDRTTAPATISLYVLFGLVVVLALFKVLFLDLWMGAKQLEERVLALEEETAAQLVELKEYDWVQEEYLRLSLTEEELSQVDIMELLALVDGVIRPQAEVSQVSISENRVMLTFSGVTLREAADLVAQLEKSPLVTATSVDTAVSAPEDQSLVEVHVYFEVAPEEESRP